MHNSHNLFAFPWRICGFEETSFTGAIWTSSPRVRIPYVLKYCLQTIFWRLFSFYESKIQCILRVWGWFLKYIMWSQNHVVGQEKIKKEII